MKKIFVLTLAVCAPVWVWGQSVTVSGVDIARVLECDRSTVSCQAQLEETRLLVQTLISQVLAAQLAGQLPADSDVYYMHQSYLDQLQETPLRENRISRF